MYPVPFLICDAPFFFFSGYRYMLVRYMTPWLLRQVYELRCCCLL